MEEVAGTITFVDAVMHLSNVMMENGQADKSKHILTQYFHICNVRDRLCRLWKIIALIM